MEVQTPNIQMVDLKGQYLKIKSEIDTGIQAVIDSCGFINGGPVKEFTADLENYLDVAHVIPCGNGTDALQIALMALGLKPGDEVITTPFTFVATAEVIALLHLKPVFVDIEEGSFNMDASKIEEVISDKTKCIIPVHLFGQGCDMEAIMKVAEKHNLFVVEDNAQAIGSKFTDSNGKTQSYGTIGHIGTTSFYPAKNLGCYGDGGAIFTNDEDLAKQIRLICNHGMDRRYYYEIIGCNSRMDSMQGVVLKTKLKHLDSYAATRNMAADFYDNYFSNHASVKTPERLSYSTHVFHQYTLMIDEDRDALQAALKEKGIPSMIYYPVPLHVQNAYAHAGFKQGDFPITEMCSEKVLSLPMHSELDETQLAYICENIVQCLNDLRA